MSTATESTSTSHDTGHQDTGHQDTGDHDTGHHGASDKQYIMIALLLAALTAIEVSTYYVDFGPLFMPTLFVLMIIKFVIVVSYFMHLKFDNKLFSYMFYAGLILAITVYAGALSTFKFFLQKG